MKTVTARRRKGYAHSLTAGHHTLVADEPESKGGADTGPAPGQLLALSLAACTAITVEMYGDRKEWDLGEVEVEVEYDPDWKPDKRRYDVVLKVSPNVSDEQAERLEAIAGKCPIHRILIGEVEIVDRVERA
jgi:putative redox protein